MKSTTLGYASASQARSAPTLFDKGDYLVLIAAALSFVFSVILWFGLFGTPNKDGGLFVAVWVPSILSLACFSKLARTSGRHG